MAMSIPRLTSAIETGLRTLYSLQNMQDPTNTGDPFYTLHQMSLVIAQSVIDEITGHARAIGTDSDGDTINIPIF